MVTRRSSRSKAKPLTLGFAGSGELDAKAIKALLDDITDGSEVKLVYLPVTADDYTTEMETVRRWCVEKDVPYATVSDEDAAKNKTLKKVIEDGEDDYGVQEGSTPGKDIIELLAGDEEEPVEDGRLLMFFNGEEDYDLEVFEATAELEVAAFDLLDGGSPLTFSDDEGGSPEPEPEPAEEEKPARRARGAKAAAPAETPASDGDEPTEEELSKLTLVELKKRAKALDPDITTEQLRGTDKPYVVDLILTTLANQAGDGEEEGSDDGEGDEAQQTSAPATRRRGAAKEVVETTAVDDEEGAEAEDPKEAVFARLRGNREAAERITAGLVRSMKAIADEADETEVLERAAAALAAGLMVFAEHVITEVRKPKSAGRPRKDGTEAQPKPPVDPDAPKRGRGRPRKAAA